jgi:hypothetical protein
MLLGWHLQKRTTMTKPICITTINQLSEALVYPRNTSEPSTEGKKFLTIKNSKEFSEVEGLLFVTRDPMWLSCEEESEFIARHNAINCNRNLVSPGSSGMFLGVDHYILCEAHPTRNNTVFLSVDVLTTFKFLIENRRYFWTIRNKRCSKLDHIDMKYCDRDSFFEVDFDCTWWHQDKIGTPTSLLLCHLKHEYQIILDRIA